MVSSLEIMICPCRTNIPVRLPLTLVVDLAEKIKVESWRIGMFALHGLKSKHQFNKAGKSVRATEATAALATRASGSAEWRLPGKA